jgi:DnaK suppressor protein|uniref:TraR/DksA family transcriptional regulator n=1 Tax=Desulfomonile tiedjei TaxID=2358 RepID=A0A7C4ETC6_9BACT
MWMTREEIAEFLGIVPNSVRGKVQKGQIERKVEGGRNLYRVVESQGEPKRAPRRSRIPHQAPLVQVRDEREDRVLPGSDEKSTFNPKEVLLNQLASIKIGRNIDAIEKGDEIDLATGEISRELDAKITMRQHKQLKEIEDALERIKLGEYGICEDCGEPIPEQRLRLFPAARLCVRCQEEMDQLEKLKEYQGVRAPGWREDATEGGFVRTFDE